MDIRKEFVRLHLGDRNSNILELGPLNRPTVDKTEYPNCRYCDIRNTEDVKALYSGNAYLEATGIWVDTSEIVEIDDVISGTYSAFYADKKKFDVVIASHVLEHMDDLIFSLRDIGGIMRPGGIFCIVYPDKRYCFDHFRQSASFRDAYNVFINGKTCNAPMVLDFYLNAVAENYAPRYWNNQDLLKLLPERDIGDALAKYEDAQNGVRMDDVHYWPFTDWDFLMFLYECTRAKLLPFRCTEFLPTAENEQQFLLALQYDPDVMRAPESAMMMLTDRMAQALPHFYSSVEIHEHNLTVQQRKELQDLYEKFKQTRQSLSNSIETVQTQTQAIERLRAINTDQERRIEELSVENAAQSSCITQLKTIEDSTIWRASAPLRHLLDMIKRN